MVRGWNRWCRFWCLVFRLFASHSRTYLTAQVLGCFKREPIWTSVTVRCTSLHDTIELITLSQWDDFLLLISKWSKNLDPSHPRVPRVVPNNSHHLTSQVEPTGYWRFAKWQAQPPGRGSQTIRGGKLVHEIQMPRTAGQLEFLPLPLQKSLLLCNNV